MLLIALLVLTALWAGVFAIVVGVCVDAARGDRALGAAARPPVRRALRTLRLVA